MIDKNAAYEAVEKNSYLLVTLLSSKVVGLIDFGQELVANEFMTQSALNDIYDEPSTSRKAADLSLNITNQVLNCITFECKIFKGVHTYSRSQKNCLHFSVVLSSTQVVIRVGITTDLCVPMVYVGFVYVCH